MSGAKSGHTASETPYALAARQREHRLKKRVRPMEPVQANADPWIIADEALDYLDQIRLRLVRLRLPIDDVDGAAELVRKLAWGPEDD